VDEHVAESLMVTLGVIMVDILVEDVTKVLLSERDDAGQTLAPHRTDEALRVGVQVRTPRWQPYASYTTGAEHVTEPASVQ